MNILHHSVAKSRHNFTSRAGLMVPATLPGRLGLGETVDELMPAPGCSGSAGAGRRGTSCRRQSPSAGGSPAGPGPGDPGHRCLGGSCEEEDCKAHLQGQEGLRADDRAHRRDRPGREVRAAQGQRAAGRE
ncbi:MAG: hypothetical protein OXF20_12785, partial [Gammaproteobacteria bacterium]|nr:hypothetical protein [Gammaproteobacteria bacterium]